MKVEDMRRARMAKKNIKIPVEATLEVIGGKWKTLIIYHLTNGPKRNGELRKAIPSITQKVLTEQLKELDEDGIVIRTSYNQVPPKVVYELSEFGWTLKPVLDFMCKWGEQFISCDHNP